MMTVGELSQYALEHANRLTAIETENEHCETRHAETSASLKEFDRKLDRIVWGMVTILATALAHLGVSLLVALAKK